jgi:UDP-glucose 4-epimerase
MDLASAHLLALEHLARGGESVRLNLGTGRGASVREVVTAAEAVVGAAIPTRLSPRRPGDPPLLVADGRAAREKLGWTPRLSELPSILTSAWAWHRKPRHREGD